MDRNLFKILATCMLVLCFSCTGEAPTSPAYEYAGNWSGSWKDYTFTMINTGTPLGSNDLLIVVEEDGSAYGKGKLVLPYQGMQFIDQLEMWLEVMPDGSATGTGKWTLWMYATLWGGEGKVVGQFDAARKEGSGSLIIEWAGTNWQFPWEVTRN